MNENIEAVRQLMAQALPRTVLSDAEDISAAKRVRLQRALGTLTKAQRYFLSNSYDPSPDLSEADALRTALAGGQYAKPSDYVNTLDWLFGAMIPEERRQEVLDAVDRCLTQPYTTGWNRRTLRSGAPSAYADKIQQVIVHFVHDRLLDYDLVSLLTGQVSEAVQKYLGTGWMHNHHALPCRIASALDREDEAVSAIVRDILAGDKPSLLLREIIEGVITSARRDMHELLGKLLLAARLQEGLRQAICECADMGTEDAFLVLLSVIEENNLIRFSSVKRAVGVWLGLASEDSGDLERVSGKSVTLIRRCLTEDAFLEDCLASQDCMAIHIALWALGFRDVRRAADRAIALALNGTHHQRLACGYFVSILQKEHTAAMLSRRVIAAFPEEMDTLAVYLPMLLSDLPGGFHHRRRGDGSRAVTDYFTDEAECRAMIAQLQHVREGLKKKLIFDPCIFPWHSAVLEKSRLAEKILCCAALLDDDELLDSLLPMLPETPVDASREYLLSYCCGNPRTPTQRRTLLTSLCDKGEWIRRDALKLVKELPLTSGDYPVLEGLLRYKYADARPELLALLMQQEDDALYGSISRLIADKQEEKRIAALDMVRTLLKEQKRPALAERCRTLITAFPAPTAKEKPLLENIRKLMGVNTEETSPAGVLFGKEDIFRPLQITFEPLIDALDTWHRYFPDAHLPRMLAEKSPRLPSERLQPEGSLYTRDLAQEDIASLTRLLLTHANDEVMHWNGESCLLGSLHDLCHRAQPGGAYLFDVWKAWYENELDSDPTRLMRACILANTHRSKEWTDDVQTLFGTGFHEEKLHQQPSRTSTQLIFLLIHLSSTFLPKIDRHRLALALMCWMLICVPDERLWCIVIRETLSRTFRSLVPLRNMKPATIILSGLAYDDDASFPLVLNAVMSLHLRMAMSRKKLTDADPTLQENDNSSYSPLWHHCSVSQCLPNVPLLIRASVNGLISRRTVYASLFTFTDQRQGMTHLSLLSTYHRLQGARPAADRYGRFAREKKELLTLTLGHEEVMDAQDAAILAAADEMCQPLVSLIIDAELRRGDTPGDLARLTAGVQRVDGAERFIRLLAGLGKDKLVRVGIYSQKGSRADALSNLLRKCVPLPADTTDTLRDLAKQHGVSSVRLIEAALYVPEWIEMVEEALALPGLTSAAYYFMAHMNEDFDEARMARIARYTPLTADELNHGAFDIAWFHSAYETLGAETFDLVYDAAKYITDGAKHARARKYADAVLGRLDQENVKAEIIAKRNKDLLMAWALIPLAGDDDVQARYLYLQQFLKESRAFGAQRSASEKTAVGIAMQNLAMNAGYADAMRLTLRMETRLTEENADLFQPQEVDGVTLQLRVDGQGLASIECTKAGKLQKSIPAKMKKNEYVLRLTEMKKQLTEQHRRAKRMLEEAMENGAIFTAGEITALMHNPVIAPMLHKLVFMQGSLFGFTDGLSLTDARGQTTSLKPGDELRLAHPFHLWQAKNWLDFQRCLFDARIVQPFRQVFRELYIQTPEEKTRTTSLRYAGHQLQPKRTLACLKGRRWVADPEAGLQKIYYQENIIATIWALADWFTPADIEAPTLEHVAFLDRITGKPVEISKVPPVLFSEVMRDVDLAVSVAHAGGIDPESSHATIEMRAALLAFTLPLFRLENVVIQGSHALIDGALARYSIHLGSGVVHQLGGTMLSVLPVHSQHRGRLFLPFADEDPKTAEIITKVLLFAEDSKIKDPAILAQIIR